MALPNLMYYYWAANLQKIVYWIQRPDADWCQPEMNACISSSLPTLVTSKLPLSPKQHSSCPIVISTLKIWSQFRQNSNLTDFSLYSPICNTHVFLPAKLDPVFVQWQWAMELLLHFMLFPPNLTYSALTCSAILRFASLFVPSARAFLIFLQRKE